MARPFVCAVVAGLCALGAHADDGLALSGYVKNLLIGSRTLIGPDERYTLALTRVRLELRGPVSDHVTLDLQYDNELLLGDYLRTTEFRVIENRDPGTYWRADGGYLDRSDVHGRHRLHRASLTTSIGDTDLRLGRQRVAWGAGRFWSPLDILNPVSAVALEREERPGVDALLVEHKLDALSRAAVVYAPQHDRRDSSLAAMWHGNRAGVDHSLVVGRFGRDLVLGIDLVGQLGDTGVRAELTRTRRSTAPGFVRALLGADHAFANTLTLSAELFYDGSAAGDRRRHAGLSARYDITPLVKTRHELVLNLDDRSHYYAPALSYSIRADLDATAAAQFFGGRPGSEFAAYRRVVYLQLQWFF